MSKADKKVLLIILDGYGHSDVHEHNAIYLAKKPHIDAIEKEYPHSLIETSGESVGLPPGVMGNSEVGHLNIGSGRIIKQEFTKIADFAKEKGFETLPDVARIFKGAGNIHIMGLFSDGGVHSHCEHLFLLLEAAKRMGVKNKIYLHLMTDGRDTPPQSALTYLDQLEAVMKKTGQGKVATVSGRYYAMDRDKRWDRVKLAYDAFTKQQKDLEMDTARHIIETAYAQGETDEFIKPKQVKGTERIKAGDSVIFINFRADRAREISQALAISGFKEFEAPVKIQPQQYLTFTQYEASFPFPVLFKPVQYKNLLGELVAAKGDKQLRIAETEKYAHVTYFFNGGEEKVFPGEDRALIPSPKEVATYDLKPEMSADLVTAELLKRVAQTEYRLIVLNFANSDMVGHTGVEKAAIKAVETLDACLGKIKDEFTKRGYDILITADHGNSECMVDPDTKAPHTAHTTNPVPFIWISGEAKKHKLENGRLCDIAPTILDILKWPKPADMTGRSLISK